MGPGDASAIRVFVHKDGAGVARATITVQAPPGWAAAPANPELVLEGNVPASTALTVLAPERGTGVTDGDVILRAAIDCPDGSEASSAIGLRVGVAPLSPRLLAGLAGVGVAGLGALAAWRWASRLAGIALRAPEREQTVAAGATARFRVVVENRRTVGERVTLAVAALPDGWSAVQPAPELLLEPREEKEVWLAVQAPLAARAGSSVDVVLHAALKEEPKRAAALVLTARVA